MKKHQLPAYHAKRNNFTRKDFEKLEDDNQHNEATLQLIKKYGKPDDLKHINTIINSTDSHGHIMSDDYDFRNRLQHHYYGRLNPTRPRNKKNEWNYLGKVERNHTPMNKGYLKERFG
jgi:hypothetical protein